MRTVRIIETTNDEKKYKVWYDFNKEEVTEEEIEEVMDKVSKQDIKELNVYVITFNDEKIETVDWMIEITKNIPIELMRDYAGAYDNLEDFREHILDVDYRMDSPFLGGQGIIEHIEEITIDNIPF